MRRMSALAPNRTHSCHQDAFAERNVMECRDIRFWNHSGLMPANLITLPHFSVSSAISLPNSAGEPGSPVAPKSAKRALIMGSARPAFTSLLSISMIAAGVFFGAPKPSHALAWHEVAHD